MSGKVGAARRFGLKTMGVVGVLVEAKARGLIAEVGPLLEQLRQEAGFFRSDRVIQRPALSTARGSPRKSAMTLGHPCCFSPPCPI